MNKKELLKIIKSIKLISYSLQTVPFLETVILNGSLSNGKANKKSDIDFLLITKPKHIFTVRFFVLFLAFLTGKKRNPNDIDLAGKYCFNYFFTNKKMVILPKTKQIALHYKYFITLWDINKNNQKIINQNQWWDRFEIQITDKNQRNFILNHLKIKRIQVFYLWQKLWEKIFENKFGKWLEKKLKNIQINKIQKSPNYYKEKKYIMFNDSELHFWPPKKNEQNN